MYLEEPKTIVLDDAHAAEDYIASLWSVSISRYELGTLYRRFLRLLEPEMEEALRGFRRRLQFSLGYRSLKGHEEIAMEGVAVADAQAPTKRL